MRLSWDDIQALFAATYIEDIAAAQREGGNGAMREKLISLSASERQMLRETLAEPEFV